MSQRIDLTPHFESISPSEFFYRNQQMAGFGNKSQALYSTVRELVENSLDSCEDQQVLPRICIHIDQEEGDILKVQVSDNGAGVPIEHVPNAFARVLYGSKYHQRQKRGTFGLGVTMAVLYGQITTNTATIVHTKCGAEAATEFKLLIDVETNTPIVESVQPRSRDASGTTVTVRMRGDLKRSQDRIIEYLRLTSVSSPHALLHLSMGDDIIEQFGGSTKNQPSPPVDTKPHPRAADLESLRRLANHTPDAKVKEWLIGAFQKVGVKTASDFLKFIGIDPRQSVSSLTREDLLRLSTGLRKYDRFESPDARALAPIGKNAFLVGVESAFNSSIQHYAKRGLSEYQGTPFVLEAVLAIGDDFPRSDTPTLYRFANRVPLLYDMSDDILNKALRRVNWSRYGLKSSTPVALFVNLNSTRVPFKAAGKQSIASVSEIEVEAVALFRDLGRRLGKTMKKHTQSAKDTRRMREFRKSLGLLAKYGSELAESDIPDTTRLLNRLMEDNHDE